MNDAPPVSGAPSGPYSPDTGIRLQRLEDVIPRIEALLKSLDDRMRTLDDRVRRVEIELAEVKGRVSQLPSTWAMITTMLGGQVAFAAAILAILRVVGTH